MSRQKRPEISSGNPQHSVEAVRDQKALFDPAPNGAGADAEAFSDLFDREESFFGRFARGATCSGAVSELLRPQGYKARRGDPSVVALRIRVHIQDLFLGL